MPSLIEFTAGLRKIWDSGVLIFPDGRSVEPTLAEFIGAVAGKVPVFMTVQESAHSLLVFNSDDNANMTLEDDGKLTLVDTNKRWHTFGLRVLTPPTSAPWWGRLAEDKFEP